MQKFWCKKCNNFGAKNKIGVKNIPVFKDLIFKTPSFDDSGLDRSSVRYRARGLLFGPGPKLIGFLSGTSSGGLFVRLLFC